MNWLQEIYKNVNSIDGINQNNAILTFDIKYDDPLVFPPETIETKITRNIKIQSPNDVSQYLVDGENYKTGDLIVRVDFATLQDCHIPQADDEATLATYRTWEVTTAGIEEGIDDLTLAGVRYTIIKVTAKKWLNDEPAYYELQLRGGVS